MTTARSVGGGVPVSRSGTAINQSSGHCGDDEAGDEAGQPTKQGVLPCLGLYLPRGGSAIETSEGDDREIGGRGCVEEVRQALRHLADVLGVWPVNREVDLGR